VNSDIHLLNPAAFGKYAPVILESASAAFVMIGGALQVDGGYPPALMLAATETTLTGVQLTLEDRFKPFIGNGYDFTYPTALHNVRVIDSSAQHLRYGTTGRTLRISGRISEHWTHQPRQVGTSLYTYVPGASNGYINIATVSNFVFTDTTLTFDLTDTTSIMAGDILLWRFNPIGGGLVKYVGPALKVASISESAVTCNLLFDRDYYDETYAPTSISILVHEWAPGQALTGDTTNGSKQITNVSPTTILRQGDWIKGTGIPANTRVSSISGTTVTVSKNATATNTGEAFYWGRLHTFTTTPAF
jgi:hypothetical protein